LNGQIVEWLNRKNKNKNSECSYILLKSTIKGYIDLKCKNRKI